MLPYASTEHSYELVLYQNRFFRNGVCYEKQPDSHRRPTSNLLTCIVFSDTHARGTQIP